MRSFKVCMDVRDPADGSVRRHEGTIEANNALNAVGHAILHFGVKTAALIRLEVLESEGVVPEDASPRPAPPETEDE